ncbi:hypothetical protein Skr01_55650 [Sphaerisporangium krabiense]|uniref:DUF3618 domain-containing protein n=1 Tax=Sphaerisporangium krabiense TaxID=763782 RepID=A0A7W8ZBA3_9ACTN|nr:DUF3618 domain-containing protein [Sphaerisporangium krabiense]MBB5630837.1 hypothetical protein [Sphaerisporangium krabiense]GII65480.1 hypothetical protein Skr01_55650 [Sphaerisporangium krabiense]
MTETDPIGRPYRPTAGEVGLHRQEPGTATSPDSLGQSLNMPQVHAAPKPYVKPVVSHGRGDPLAGLSESSLEPSHEAPPETYDEVSGYGRSRYYWSEEDRLRDDIHRTREELGLTVEALAQKVDVKARARRKVSQTKDKAAEMAGRLRGGPHPHKVTADGAGTTRAAGSVPVGTGGADRRPAALIVAGLATMIGAGWAAWGRRRYRGGALRHR